MGRVMTFVVLVWLSVVLVLSAWTIAQSGRYIRVGSAGIVEHRLDTHTGTTYRYRGLQGGYEVWVCGPADYFCERGR